MLAVAFSYIISLNYPYKENREARDDVTQTESPLATFLYCNSGH